MLSTYKRWLLQLRSVRLVKNGFVLFHLSSQVCSRISPFTHPVVMYLLIRQTAMLP